MGKILMNPATGSVATESEWLDSFEGMNAEAWGGVSFEDAGLVEVVPNIEGEEGYDPEYGQWREKGDSTPDDGACPQVR